MLRLRREQVIAYRVAAQGLLRDGESLDDLAVLDFGVQDSADSAQLALDARLPAPPPPDIVGPERPLALAWSLRGAPHLHRRRDLDRVAGALWPLSDADALARVDASSSMKKAGIGGFAGFTAGVEAMRKIVTAPMGKGAVSTAMTAATPAGMHRYCRACKATHVFEMVLRLATLPAGIELEPDTAPPVLIPRKGATAPEQTDIAALQALIRAYLRLLGPGSEADVAGYVGARRGDLVRVWPDDLVQVEVEGQLRWLAPEAVPVVNAASPRKRRPARLTRLLGPFDPYLQARDRDLIVPDPAVQKALWPILGRPGVVFVDGEVLGTWRPKRSKSRLEIGVETFAPLPPAIKRQIEAEAQRVGQARGAAEAAVRWA